MNIDTLKKMVTQFPDDALMQFSLGQKYFDIDDQKNAKIHLESAHKLDQTHLLAMLLLAQININEAETDKAKSLLLKGIETMPTLPSGSGQDLKPEFLASLNEIEEDEF